MNSKKYKIDELLESLTVAEYKKAVIQIPAELGVSRNYFQRMRKVKVKDKLYLNSNQLIIIADYLNVSVDDLLNKSFILCQSTSS